MSTTPGQERDSGERRRAREELLADREEAARTRSRRRVGLRPPTTLPIPAEPTPSS